MALRRYEAADLSAARRAYLERGDAAGALRAMPRRMHTERLMLAELAAEPNNYLRAVLMIPRRLVMLYCHAWQSYVFNIALSERVSRHGTEPIEGDLVWDDEKLG